MKRFGRWLADRYAWFRWQHLTPWGWEFTDYQRAANECRAQGKPVYTRGWLALLGND